MMNEINVQEYEEVVMDDRRLFFPPKLYTNENFVVNQEKTLLICAPINEYKIHLKNMSSWFQTQFETYSPEQNSRYPQKISSM